MLNSNRLMKYGAGCLVAMLAIALITGCQTSTKPVSGTTAPAPVKTAAAPAPVPVPPPAPAAPVPAAAPAAPVAATAAAPVAAIVPVTPPVRIKAGGPATATTDAEGNVWQPYQGFTDGDTFELSDAQIANTKTPELYRTERYSMTAFSYPVPNGKYTVKLHFAEVYDGITGPGMRVFSFNVEGKEFKDFDIWVKAGGPNKAYVESVDVEVTDGKLDITFTPKEENPKINGIEILPGP